MPSLKRNPGLAGANAPEDPRAPSWSLRLRVLIWLVAALSLALVFLAYLNPHLALDLANRVWACF